MSKSSLYLIVAFMFTLLMCLLLFNSIRSSEWNNEQSVEENARKEITLSHWAYFPDDIFKRFSQEYPDITVNYQHYNSAGYNEIIQQKLIMGEEIDLLGVKGNKLSQYISRGWLKDMGNSNFIKRFRPEIIQVLRAQNSGILYAIPFEAEYYGIWYNKILFDKYNLDVPETFGELLSVCNVLKQHDVDPLVFGARDADSAAYLYFLRIFGAIDSGSKWSDYCYGDKRFTDADTISLFYDTQNFIDRQYINPDSINLTYQQAFDYFKNAKAAMLIAPDSSFDMAKDDFEKVCNPKVFVIPYSDNPSLNKTFADYSVLLIGINKKTANPSEAEKLLSFLSRQDIIQMYCEQTISYPTTINADTSYLRYNEIWEPIRQNVLQEVPFASLSSEDRVALNSLAKRFIAGLVDAAEVAQQFDVIFRGNS